MQQLLTLGFLSLPTSCQILVAMETCRRAVLVTRAQVSKVPTSSPSTSQSSDSKVVSQADILVRISTITMVMRQELLHCWWHPTSATLKANLIRLVRAPAATQPLQVSAELVLACALETGIRANTRPIMHYLKKHPKTTRNMIWLWGHPGWVPYPI